MGRTDYNISRPGFIVDFDSIARDGGRKIDFDRVPTSFQNSEGDKEIPGSTVMSQLGSGKIIPRSAAEVTITNLTEDGAGTATATAADHGLEVGDPITVSGAGVADYNGDFEVASVVDADTFTYDGVENTPADDASGATAIIKASNILLDTAKENNKSAAINGTGVILGGVIYKTLMEESGDADFETYLTELKAAGTGFVFQSYSDNRSS